MKLDDYLLALAAAGFAENARALLSTSIGDVFGGMGSWNDEAPRDAADAAALSLP